MAGKKRKRGPGRRKGEMIGSKYSVIPKTQITMRLENDLLEQIDQIAFSENQTRTEFIKWSVQHLIRTLHGDKMPNPAFTPVSDPKVGKLHL